MKEHRGTKEKVYSRLCLAANLFLYVGFALWDGPVWCRDSESYATMDYTREPAYCTFLWLMRRIVGEGGLVSGWDLTDREGGKIAAQEPAYLLAVIVCQAVVMAAAVWYLARTVYGIGKRSGAGRTAEDGLLLSGSRACASFGAGTDTLSRTGSLYAAAANVLLWGVDVLNRFGAKRGSAYFQSIMTEGFGIPFYIFFLLFLYRYLSGRERRYLAAAAGMMVLCTSHHKQLGITMVIFAAAALTADVLQLRSAGKAGTAAGKTGKKTEADAGKAGRKPEAAAGKAAEGTDCVQRNRERHIAGRQLCRDLLALAAAGVLVFLIGHGYNRIFHGVWSFHTGSADKIDSTLLYTAAQEDAKLFERYGGEDAEELRQLFLQIEEELTERRLRYADAMGEAVPEQETEAAGTENAGTEAAGTEAAGTENAAGKSSGGDTGASVQKAAGWVELCSHYADSYDIIGFEVLDPLVDAYVREQHPELEPGTMTFSVAADQVCRELERVLLHQQPGRLLHLWLNNLRKGLVNTVLRVGTVLNWAALLLWSAYAVLLLAGVLSGRGRGSRSCSGELLLAGLVFLGTLVNAAVVGAIIFPQTRYMIYNMGLFYVCLVMLADSTRQRRRSLTEDAAVRDSSGSRDK